MGSQDIKAILTDPEAKAAIRAAQLLLAKYCADEFREVSGFLHIMGSIVGDDRKSGLSPFNYGNDATVAVSLLLAISAQLIQGAADLFSNDLPYAGSALARQLVEVEYLAWAFETNNDDAATWLRSNHKARQQFFTPAKLRKAAGERFRSVDYSYHCELGGHPTPHSWQVLDPNSGLSELMLSDALGHVGRIWDHLMRWSLNAPLGAPIKDRAKSMFEHFEEWKAKDPLTNLGPAPDLPLHW